MGAHRKQPNSKGEWRCSKCKTYKPASSFTKDKSQYNGIAYACRDCNVKDTRRYNIKAKYGIILDEYNQKLAEQNSKCACCGTQLVENSRVKSEQPMIDHCHTTGKFRAILCNHCNRLVGYLKEDATYAGKLKQYITEYC